MANTPQAKKRIRRNTARTVVNKIAFRALARWWKKVENAVAAGDKRRGRNRAEGCAARNGARRCQGRASAKEHRGAKFSRPTKSVNAIA